MVGKVRSFYPGGNTSQGFYSFYDFIIDRDATRIFVIKGGPLKVFILFMILLLTVMLQGFLSSKEGLE